MEQLVVTSAIGIVVLLGIFAFIRFAMMVVTGAAIIAEHAYNKGPFYVLLYIVAWVTASPAVIAGCFVVAYLSRNEPGVRAPT